MKKDGKVFIDQKAINMLNEVAKVIEKHLNRDDWEQSYHQGTRIAIDNVDFIYSSGEFLATDDVGFVEGPLPRPPRVKKTNPDR